jgi:glycosyltransferase involved in cell wall biosynthesis
MNHQQRGVLTITGVAAGSEYWRVWAPARALQAQGYPAAYQPRTASPPADLDRYAAVVWARLLWARDQYAAARDWRDDLHRRGLAVLYELDDDALSPAHTQQAAVRCPQLTAAEIEQQRQDRLYALRLCDGVTVPTPALAKVVEQYTDRPVVVVPSATPWASWRAECRQGAGYGDGLTIGWAGGPRHDADFTELAEAWGRIAARYPAVRFVVIGYCSPLIQAAVPAGRLTRVRSLPIDLYPRAYKGIDIMCCPLADTEFNRCKSPIKAFEAAAAGCAVVASPTVYESVCRKGIDGLVVESVAGWTVALGGLLREPETRQAFADSWAARVRTRHNLDVDASMWPRAWGRLIGAARVPAGAD